MVEAGARPRNPDPGAHPQAGEGAVALTRLLTWLSPAFPTGAFAYSHGLEWAVESGDVTGEAEVLAWVADVLRHGAGHSDAVVLRQAYAADEVAALAAVADVAEAAAGGRERRAETLGQGDAFGIAARVWGAPLLAALGRAVAYPVAVGALARAHAVTEGAAVAAYLHAFAANLVGAAIRLVPLGQTAGLRLQLALEPTIHALVDATAGLTLDDIGGACFRSDIAAMRHETQYTRLFRT